MASQPLDPPSREPHRSLNLAFQALVSSSHVFPMALPLASTFVERAVVPKVQIMSTASQMKALALRRQGLIGQFSGIWPSSKSMEIWISKNWMPLITEGLQHCFCGKGFYTFLFKNKEGRDLIFRSGPYFMGPQGLYLNRWTLSFDSEKDVPSAMLV